MNPLPPALEPGEGAVGPVSERDELPAEAPGVLARGSASSARESGPSLVPGDTQPDRPPRVIARRASEAGDAAYAPLLMSDPDATARKPARQTVRKPKETPRAATSSSLPPRPAACRRDPGAAAPDLGRAGVPE